MIKSSRPLEYSSAIRESICRSKKREIMPRKGALSVIASALIAAIIALRGSKMSEASVAVNTCLSA